MVSRIGLGLAITLSCFQIHDARAAYTIDVTQSNGNVIATGSGTIDLNGLSYVDQFNGPPDGGVAGNYANIVIGRSTLSSGYSGLSGPSSFGTQTPGAFVIDATGGPVGVQGFSDLLFVPIGYVSGTPLTASSTFINATFSSLGIIPGIYTYTWSTTPPQTSAITSAIDIDSLTVDIGVPVAVPEPAALALLAAPLALLGVLRRLTRGESQSPA